MHQKQEYEQLITGKLEALPLPDMADAIWNRIEKELDTDLPTNDGGNGAPSQPLVPRGFIFGGISVLFLLSFLAYIFLIQSPDTKPSTILSRPRSAPSQTITTDNKPPGGTEIKNTVSSSSEKKDSPSGIVTVPVDSVFNAGITPPALVDTSSSSASVANLPSGTQSNPVPLALQDSIPKKKRGVSGISDKDYRIIPKKDQ